MKISYLSYEIGAHTSFEKNIYQTIITSLNHGMYATQFFLGNPKSYKRTIIDPNDIFESKKLLKNFPLKVFSHFPYIANLAGSVENLAWNGNLEQDNKTSEILKSLEYELKIISQFDNCCGGVVIHPGSYKNRKIGLETIAKTINKINFPKNSRLLLENSAGQGSNLATTFDEIKSIIDLINHEKKKYVSVCIDTCHIFAYGSYNLAKIENIRQMFYDFDRIIGKNYLGLIHLNDSREIFGSKKDRHACIGQGYIWKDNDSSLFFLLEEIKERKIPAILETEISDLNYFYKNL